MKKLLLPLILLITAGSLFGAAAAPTYTSAQRKFVEDWLDRECYRRLIGPERQFYIDLLLRNWLQNLEQNEVLFLRVSVKWPFFDRVIKDRDENFYLVIDVGDASAIPESFYEALPRALWSRLLFLACSQIDMPTRARIAKAWADAGRDPEKLTFASKCLVHNTAAAPADNTDQKS
jgi:hypothetical protein